MKKYIYFVVYRSSYSGGNYAAIANRQLVCESPLDDISKIRKEERKIEDEDNEIQKSCTILHFQLLRTE